MSNKGPSTPKHSRTPAAPMSPAPNKTDSLSAESVQSPKPVPASSVKLQAVDVPLKGITIFTKGCVATKGTVIRSHDKVMTTNGGSPYFFFVIQDEVRLSS